MRSRLTPDVILLSALLLVTLVIAIFAVRSGRSGEQEEEFPPRRTTYSPAPGGYQALYETLETLGYPVRRWRSSLDSLEDRGTLIVAAPEPGSPITPAEWRGLAEWVRRGSLLIYLPDSNSADADLAGLADLLGTAPQTSRPAQPTPPAAIATDLRTRAGFHLDQPAFRDRIQERLRRLGRTDASALPPDPWSAATLVPLYRDDRGATIAYTSWGRGAVIVSSSPWSLSTAGVSQGDNFAWLLATIAAYGPEAGVQAFRPGTREAGGGVQARPSEHLNAIFFDEYHHGYGQSRGILSLLAPIARLGLAQLGVAWLLLTYAVSRRFGGRLPDEGRVRRSRSEYLGSMASLLQRARAVDLAVAQVRHQFVHDATRALGLPRDAEEPALLSAAASRGVDAERLGTLLERADRLIRERNRTDQEEALAVARELSHVRRQLRGEGSVASGEREPLTTDRLPVATHHSHD